MNANIVEMTRGHIVLDLNGKTVKIEGEAFLRGHGSPDFVLYRNSIVSWNSPFDHVALTISDKETILAAAAECLSMRGISFEIE